MDPNAVVLDISSDEDDDRNWVAELLGDDGGGSDEVVVVKSSLVDLDDDGDDCVVLDEDPNAVAVVRSGGGCDGGDEDEIVVVSEKGQVACRDYPHSRHLCIKFPFSSTPNQSHCDQCYCYVCDSLAPCVFWGNGSASADHCRATDKDEFWILERKNAKNGGKVVQPVGQLPPVDLYTPAPVMVQSPNQIPTPGPIYPNHTAANFQSPYIISSYRNNILASRNKLHPELVSQFMHRVQQRHNVGSRVHRPVFKRTNPVRAATTVSQNRYSSHRVNLGNPIRQQNYQVNGMLSGSSRYLGPMQQNAVNNSVPYPPQSQTYTSSTLNQPQPRFSSHSNLNYQSQVNSNPISKNPFYSPPIVPPPSSRPRPRPRPQPQPNSSQQTYMMTPVQPSYHVPSNTQVDSLLVPVSNFTQDTSQGNQSQGPIVDSGFKDNGLGLPTGQDSATFEGVGSATNESSLTAVSGSLANYQFDWIFDDQPIEPGFTDYSSDSAYMDTGPIFYF